MHTPPKAFVSYSWDSEDHKRWVRNFAARLRGHGVDVSLDQWHAVPEDQLPAFMEQAVHENDFVLIVCTPCYKEKTDTRTGGVGYEGDIITGEVLTSRNHRKFIPILRNGEWDQVTPSCLAGKYYIDLRGEPYSESSYSDLLNTLHNRREQAPSIGLPPEQLERDFENLDQNGLVRLNTRLRDHPALTHMPPLFPGAPDLSLAALYVELRVTSRRRQPPPSRLLTEPLTLADLMRLRERHLAAHNLSIDHAILHDRSSRFVIAGDPGSGKSSLLKYITQQVAIGAWPRWSCAICTCSEGGTMGGERSSQ